MAIPEPPWRAAPRQRPARAPLSREAIVDAALRVLDREGAGGLSMRRVAEELGTGPASLYWHVANKDARIDLIIDRVAGEVGLPEPDPDHWQEQLRAWLLQVRRVFHTHPGVAALTLGRIPTGPNLVRWLEWTLVLLRGAGIPDRVAAYAGDLLGLYLGATGYEATLAPPSPSGEPLSPEDSAAMVRGYYESMPADQFPNVLATLDELFSGGPEERFELGLDVILRGLASYARS
ncbi:MAG TPA: TetR/AcrR family transcriptional regulator [Actinomycetes bacterium]|nr:TetR/AcrR family transcriptional regulator [Actinomycetes bacterium]